MAEYIEREAVALKVKRHLMPNVDIDGTVSVENAERYFLKLLAEQPAADVIEVVRCKDCEHRYVPCHCALWYGTANGTEYFIERGDDFSCSYGKRKEGAEE